MKTPTITLLPLLLLLFSCNNPAKEKHAGKAVSLSDTQKKDSAKTTGPLEATLRTVPKDVKPVWGYRFILSGDFDGDGKEEQLREYFCSGLDNKETNKFYEGLSDYDQLVALTQQKEPYSFISSDNALMDTLHIAAAGQLLGLSYLKNEGDLNGDCTDEISYVVNWADWSNLNTWHVATYKNKKWMELYSFPIWDWQLPNLPETFNQYGLFGLEDKGVNTTNDKVNSEMEKELKDFKGLVKKIKNNQIQIIFRNEGDEDTMIVDLKRSE